MQLSRLVAVVMVFFHVAKSDLLACCNRTNSDPVCHGVCTSIFANASDLHISSSQLQNVTLACPSSYHQLWLCINQTTVIPAAMSDFFTPTEVTQVTTEADYYCCDRALDRQCRDTCRKELGSDDETAAIQRVITACGPPPTGPMWECFFAPTTDPPRLEPVSIDWARIQCCNHASASVCRDSCVQVYSGIILPLSWETLQLDCIHRPSEASLTTCLNDVSSPCKMGCNGLRFCSNFNNRPIASFRHCSIAADHMAKNDYYNWVNYRHINHPLVTVLLKDIESCRPALWKALACSIHIQPCHPITHSTQICREDCIELLGDCSNSTYSIAAICDIIAPASTNDNCISLSEYTKPSQKSKYEVSLVTNPCDPNPCKEGFFCSVNNLCRHGDHACSHYFCEPGCSLGDSPSLIYPGGSRIKVPVEMLSSDNECFGYFNCSSPSGGGGRVQLVPHSSVSPPTFHCEQQLHCYIGEDLHPHLSQFQPDDCNFCTCYYGRITCTNLSCKTSQNSTTYIDCDCSRVYQPVCTSYGHTLPNACIANCLGYTLGNYKSGDCKTFDPCSGHSCGDRSQCMPNHHVCLQDNLKECTQYTCESLLQTCSSQTEPVCDASNSQHSNICNFLRTQEGFGYRGYCREGCSRIKAHRVCGVNGETFETFCHAESLHIAVDYYGPCTAVPGSGPGGSCSGVVCPSLSHPTCKGVTPWSACCPKCGGLIYILMDEESLNINSNALGQREVSSVNIIGRLRHYITSLQCDLYGFMAADMSLSVLVLPVINASTKIVIEACNQEAVKLATLINNRAPMLASDPLLSHLIAARVEMSHVDQERHIQDKSEGVASPNSTQQVEFSFALILIFIFISFMHI